MLQLNNKSPFAPAITLFANKDGVDALYIMVKATFDLNAGQIQLSENQLPPTQEDEYWGDPLTSSLKNASDYHIGKTATDFILKGQAWVANGGTTDSLDVSVSIAEKQKTVRVFGQRVWQNGTISSPELFEHIPLVYEYSYGGSHIISGDPETILVEERNPVGMGFRGQRSDEEMDGSILPYIEDPDHLISEMGDQVTPVGFGAISPAWLPRREYAGTYDENWEKHRAPYLPEDFDGRFLSCAHPDFVFDRYLQGGEPVQIINASQDGTLQFYIPVCDITARVKIAKRTEEPLLNLETVIVEPEDNRLTLHWSAEQLCDKEQLKISEIEINLSNIQK